VLKNIFCEFEGNLYVAVSSFCTHFCCAPGYREAEKLARPRAAWDNIFCTCHNSNYNYRQPVAFSFAPEVATESGGFDPMMSRAGGA
jgi:Rieske Fe-S protein